MISDLRIIAHHRHRHHEAQLPPTAQSLKIATKYQHKNRDLQSQTTALHGWKQLEKKRLAQAIVQTGG